MVSVFQDLRRENLHFSHGPSSRHVATIFGEDGILAPRDRLTLVVRTDAAFATKKIVDSFARCGQEVRDVVHGAYRAWGHEIVDSVADHLDYEGRYGLPSETASLTNIHFHHASSLAGSIIQKAEDFVRKEYPDGPDPLYISLDDMIHADVFHAFANSGKFGEVGFSRLFSLVGEELGFVGRPGKSSLDEQMSVLVTQVQGGKGCTEQKTPIVILEDNVRRAKTLLWIFDEMHRHGVLKNAVIAAVATCFSVAKEEELSQLSQNGRNIPLLVGMNYAGSHVEVITPRDHFFDGYVVEQNGRLGRLPSFMLPPQKVAENFRIDPSRAKNFITQVIETNIAFCDRLKVDTGCALPVGWFGPADLMSRVAQVSPDAPVRSLLEKYYMRNAPCLAVVK